MTEEMRDDLITLLTLHNPTQIRKILCEYQQLPKKKDCEYLFYEFLKEKFENESYSKKPGSLD
jgi:hypothetical protein